MHASLNYKGEKPQTSFKGNAKAAAKSTPPRTKKPGGVPYLPRKARTRRQPSWRDNRQPKDLNGQFDRERDRSATHNEQRRGSKRQSWTALFQICIPRLPRAFTTVSVGTQARSQRCHGTRTYQAPAFRTQLCHDPPFATATGHIDLACRTKDRIGTVVPGAPYRPPSCSPFLAPLPRCRRRKCNCR
jgi:hypothetical protein